MSERSVSNTVGWLLCSEEAKYLHLMAKEPLNIFIDRIERNYGFRPTEMECKKRFERWGWRKNNGKGKPSTVPKVPALPKDLARPDIIFRATHIYITDSFALEKWQCNDFGDYERRDGLDKARSFEELKRTLHLVMEIPAVSRNHERRHFLSEYITPLLAYVFQLLCSVAAEHHPLTLIQILALANMLVNDHSEIVYQIIVTLGRLSGLTQFHPLQVILRQLADLLNPNRSDRLDTAQIRVCLKEFCKAIADCFIKAPTPCQKGINAFLVEFSRQTGTYDAATSHRDHLQALFPRLLSQSDINHGYSSDMSLNLTYWQLKFTTHHRRPPHAIITDLLNRCCMHKAVCHDQACSFAERGLYAAYEESAKQFDRCGFFGDANNDLYLSIGYRLEYDRVLGRPHSASAICKLLQLYTRYMNAGQAVAADTTVKQLKDHLEPYKSYCSSSALGSLASNLGVPVCSLSRFFSKQQQHMQVE